MKTEENISKKFIDELNELHATGQHHEVVERLEAYSKTATSYVLTNLLARALNNINRYQEALALLESVRIEGEADKRWQFRMGYSLFYLDGREVEAIPYFERAIALGDDFPSTYELLREAKSFVDEGTVEAPKEEDIEEVDCSPKAFAHLSLKMRLRPEHRERIETPLNDLLSYKKWGYVAGGGTLLSDDGELEMCDIEIDLVEYSEKMRDALYTVVEKLEVAKGSTMTFSCATNDDTQFDATYPIGNLVGLGIYINKKDLPEEREEENEDISDIFHSLVDVLSSNGALIPSYGDNGKEVALYFYGEGEYIQMKNKAIALLKNTPLGRKCRTVQIA